VSKAASKAGLDFNDIAIETQTQPNSGMRPTLKMSVTDTEERARNDKTKKEDVRIHHDHVLRPVLSLLGCNKLVASAKSTTHGTKSNPIGKAP
jgi:hypothetical protein